MTPSRLAGSRLGLSKLPRQPEASRGNLHVRSNICYGGSAAARPKKPHPGSWKADDSAPLISGGALFEVSPTAMNHAISLNRDPKELAASLRDEYGEFAAWTFAAHQADAASASADLKTAMFWRRYKCAERSGSVEPPAAGNFPST